MPQFNKRVQENRIQKFVDRRVEVPIEKYVEVPQVREQNKVFQVETKVQRAVNRQRTNVKQLKKSVRRSNLSRTQQQTYHSLGETLNRYKIDNIKLSLEIKAIEQ